jgi:hypothetical protein
MTNLISMTVAVTPPGSGNRGDIMVVNITDTTYSYMYRITTLQYSASRSGNYNLIIEQLG